VWITGVQTVFAVNSNIIRLIHHGIMGIYAELFTYHVHFENIMIRIISNKHFSLAVKADTVTDASVCQLYKYAAVTGWCYFSDGSLFRIVNRIYVALFINGRTFRS